MKPRNDAIRKCAAKLREFLENNGCFIHQEEFNRDCVVIKFNVHNLKTKTFFEISITAQDFKSYEKSGKKYPIHLDILNKPLYVFCFYHTGQLQEFSAYGEDLYCEKYKDAEKMASELIKFYSVEEFKTYIRNKRNELGM